jgi:hypothetical protein
MFALLRHIGRTSRHEIPPPPAALRAPRKADASVVQEPLADRQRHRSRQAQKALSALGKGPHWASILLVVAAAVWAAVARGDSR